MQKGQIYKELLREYDKKRTAAHIELDARKAEIYEMVPRIKKIDDEIAASGFKMAFSALDGADKQGLKAFKQRCDALVKEKNALLKEAGISKKYLEPRYDCKLCGDTGFIGAKECACLMKRRIDKIYSAYQLRDRLETETFDNFDFRYYSSKKASGREEAPRKNMEKIVKYCLGYTKEFDKKKQSVLFYGPTGLGKTFLCNSIAKELMDKGYSVIYISAFSLFKLMSEIQLGKTDAGDADRVAGDFLSADLLIVDDIGTEFATIITNTSFFSVINTRQLNSAPVVLSTNLYPDELKELYSERVFSRIVGSFALFEFYGEDVRLLKKYGKFLD